VSAKPTRLSNLTVEALDAGHSWVQTACAWVHCEWGKQSGRSYSETQTRLFLHEHAPQPQIALNGETPVGLISFQRHSLPKHEKRKLWIDALYVVPECRGQGIGSELVRLAERLAADYESRLYVYTAASRFYTRLGWTVLIDMDPAGCRVLERELPTSRSSP